MIVGGYYWDSENKKAKHYFGIWEDKEICVSDVGWKRTDTNQEYVVDEREHGGSGWILAVSRRMFNANFIYIHMVNYKS